MITRLYENLQDINIILFHEILENKEYTKLDLNWLKEKEYTDLEQAQCYEQWLKLYDSFFEAKNDGRAKNSLAKSEKVDQLRLKIFTLSGLINALIDTHNFFGHDADLYAENKQKILALVKEVDDRIKFDHFQDIPKLKERLEKYLISYQNELGLIEKRTNQVEKKVKKYIEETLVNIQNALGYALGKFSDISVIQFIFYEKEAIKKIEISKNNGRK